MDRRRVRPGPQRRPALDLDDVVYGVHAVHEALVAGERLRRIHIADERKRDPALRDILEGAQEANVPVRFESRGFFASFPYKAHQSVVAFGVPFDYVTIEDALAARRPNAPIVVLDHLTDPHNVGAILRTAECAGAGAVVIPDRRSAGINATVRKASAGASAYIPVARVGNVAQALRTLQKAGLWVYGAAGDGGVPYGDTDFTGDVAIVIGAEGEGLSQTVRAACDGLVAIPLLGRVGSLNASVAAGILLFEIVRQRRAAAAKGEV